jgi:tRNA uridine 5-carboxymethylaminomethyl modification enzyme
MSFAEEWRLMLEGTCKSRFYQRWCRVNYRENGKIKGVRTSIRTEIKVQALDKWYFSFFNGLIHVGDKQRGGRAGEGAAHGITEDLIKVGWNLVE